METESQETRIGWRQGGTNWRRRLGAVFLCVMAAGVQQGAHGQVDCYPGQYPKGIIFDCNSEATAIDESYGVVVAAVEGQDYTT